jgi:hypothetical protein
MRRPALTDRPLPLGDSLEDRTLVEVTAIEGMPDRPDKCVETANAQHEKIGVKMIHGPWRFEYDTTTWIPSITGASPGVHVGLQFVDPTGLRDGKARVT